MCWHKWDIKKSETQFIFIWLKALDKKINGYALGISGGLLSFITMALYAYSTKPFVELTPVEKMELGCIIVIFGVLVALLYALLLGLIFIFLEPLTEVRDKICLKCHLSVFNASRAEMKIAALEEKKKQNKEQKEAEHEALQLTANEVFGTRKTMWAKAQG